MFALDSVITLVANTIIKIGYIEIKPQSVATIMVTANNRTTCANLEFGICINESEVDIRWAGEHQNVGAYRTISNTWIFYNNTDAPFNLNVYGKSSNNADISFVFANVLFTPIIN